MAKINEIIKSIEAFGEIGKTQGTVRELAWILKNIVREDLVQAKKIAGTTEK